MRTFFPFIINIIPKNLAFNPSTIWAERALSDEFKEWLAVTNDLEKPKSQFSLSLSFSYELFRVIKYLAGSRDVISTN